MKIIADLHTHTVASTHAYSTLQEMVTAASEMGLSAIAVTDHGVEMPGAPKAGTWYFSNLRSIPHLYHGVLVLRGQETNVLNMEGKIDLEKEAEPWMDWIVASIHPPCFQSGGKQNDVTSAWQGIAKNPAVNVIGHCGDPRFPFDYEKMIPVFRDAGKLVELNEATFSVRSQSISNCKKIMQLCKKYSTPIVVDSDSHFSANVGKFPQALALLQELNFPEELIINSNIERLKKYLQRYTRVFEDHTLSEGGF